MRGEIEREVARNVGHLGVGPVLDSGNPEVRRNEDIGMVEIAVRQTGGRGPEAVVVNPGLP